MRLITIDKNIKEQIESDINNNLQLESKLDILHFVLTDKSFLEHARGVLSPEIFPAEYQNILIQALDYFDHYHIVPDNYILDILSADERILATRILNRKVKDKEQRKQYLLDRLLTIYGSHLITIATQQTQEIINTKQREKNNNTEIRKTIDTIISLWEEVRQQTSKYTHYGIEITDSTNLDNITKHIINEQQRLIRTGFSQLDKLLTEGIKAGDVILIQAPTGVGKSMFMMNIATNILLEGKNFLYLTLELNEIQAYKRFMQIITGSGPVFAAKMQFNDFRAIVSEYFKEYSRFMGKGRIIYATPRVYTTDDIFMLLHRLKTNYGFIPDALFIDYADYLLPTKAYKERRFELERIFLDLQNLSDDANIPIFTASQVGRQAASRQNIKNEDSFEGYTKSQIADAVIGLNYLTDEQAIIKTDTFLLNAYISKSRLGGAKESVQFEQDKQSTRMWEKDSPRLTIKLGELNFLLPTNTQETSDTTDTPLDANTAKEVMNSNDIEEIE